LAVALRAIRPVLERWTITGAAGTFAFGFAGALALGVLVVFATVPSFLV